MIQAIDSSTERQEQDHPVGLKVVGGEQFILASMLGILRSQVTFKTFNVLEGTGGEWRQRRWPRIDTSTKRTRHKIVRVQALHLSYEPPSPLADFS